MTPVTLVIHGMPVVQKNGKQIVKNRGTGQSFLISKQSVRQWRKSACEQLQEQWAGRPPIAKGVELNAAIVSYLGPRQHPDADGLLAAPLDALQQAGVLENDYWVRRFDGSDRKRDDANPRVEITLTEIRGE